MKLIILIYMVVLLSACSTIVSKKKSRDVDTIDVYIFAESDVNQNLLGDNSPVKITILQLYTEVEFNQMNQLSLTDSYKEHLGESVLEETNMMIHSDEHLQFKLPLNPKSDYLGFIIYYRDIDRKWKFQLSKQDKKWYQSGGEFLYLDIEKDGVIQLTKKQALEKLVEEKIQNEKEKLSDLKEKEVKKLKKNIKKVMNNKKSADLKKGIYIEPKSAL